MLSHFGFGLLIFFISINHIFSIEDNFNIRAGEKRKNYIIKFENLKTNDNKNYKSVVGNFEIFNKKKLIIEKLNLKLDYIINLKP